MPEGVWGGSAFNAPMRVWVGIVVGGRGKRVAQFKFRKWDAESSAAAVVPRCFFPLAFITGINYYFNVLFFCVSKLYSLLSGKRLE